jgi:hypothetical protein
LLDSNGESARSHGREMQGWWKIARSLASGALPYDFYVACVSTPLDGPLWVGVGTRLLDRVLDTDHSWQ